MGSEVKLEIQNGQKRTRWVEYSELGARREYSTWWTWVLPLESRTLIGDGLSTEAVNFLEGNNEICSDSWNPGMVYVQWVNAETVEAGLMLALFNRQLLLFSTYEKLVDMIARTCPGCRTFVVYDLRKKSRRGGRVQRKQFNQNPEKTTRASCKQQVDHKNDPKNLKK